MKLDLLANENGVIASTANVVALFNAKARHKTLDGFPGNVYNL